MKFNNTLAPCLLMKVIDILGNNRLELALFLKSDKCLVSFIRFGIRIYQFALVEIIEIFCVRQKIMCNDVYRTIFRTALSIIDTRSASEIREFRSPSIPRLLRGKLYCLIRR